MAQKEINLIVACDEQRIMGCEGRLPWSIPEDHVWFHEKTAGCILILGRICYESWPRVHEEGRVPIVITSRNEGELRPVKPEQARKSPPLLAHSTMQALALAQDLPGELFVCGGERIFEETLALAKRIYLTQVHAQVKGDVRFPEWRKLKWQEGYRKESQDGNYRYTFSILERQDL
jgi:dihydrofolate reductase